MVTIPNEVVERICKMLSTLNEREQPQFLALEAKTLG